MVNLKRFSLGALVILILLYLNKQKNQEADQAITEYMTTQGYLEIKLAPSEGFIQNCGSEYIGKGATYFSYSAVHNSHSETGTVMWGGSMHPIVSVCPK